MVMRGRSGQTRQQNPQQLEFQFQACANNLFEGLMDLNAEAYILEDAWRDVMALRAKVAQAYGVPGAGAATTGGGKGAGAAATGGGRGAGGGKGGGAKAYGAPGAGAGAAATAEVSWKNEFYIEYQKRHNTVPSKEDCTWEVQETSPVEGEHSGHICVLTCSGLEYSYQGAEPSTSKKLAEHMAAKAAIKAEFKEAFARLSRGGGAAGRGQQGKGGQKRKADALTAVAGNDISAKDKLQQAVQLLCGVSLEKGAIVYECAEEGGQYTATVTMQTYDPSVGYQGLPASGKKAAETQAAEAALIALATQIDHARELDQAKKKAKNAESFKAFKERSDAKKEANA